MKSVNSENKRGETVDEKDWQLLKVLDHEKSATKAANKLFWSQAALSYRLSRMETEMNTRLFIRSSKGIRFTSAGERLIAHADKMLRQYTDIKADVNACDGVVSGTLRLGSSAVFAHNQLPLLLKDFHGKFPAVDISLHTGLSNLILRKIQNEEIAVAIIRGHHPWNGVDILLQDEPLCIVAATPLTLAELPQLPYIQYDTDPTMQFQIDSWWQQNFSVPPKVFMHADSVYTCRQLVMAGLGWSIMPSLRLANHTQDFYIQEIYDQNQQPYRRLTRLIYSHAAKEIDAVSVFIDFICQRLGVQRQ
jgi:DNA-binding transcriptional LysR family regulator